MDHFVGIDVSLDSCAVCVVTPSGVVAREAKGACEPETLIAFLCDLNLTIACVGLEAGPLSQWLYRHLREAELETVLMETRQVKGVLKAMPIKTDRRDALGSPVRARTRCQKGCRSLRGLPSRVPVMTQGLPSIRWATRSKGRACFRV
ncbi:MAG: hypothetical protein U1D35_07945 [Paracoccaceae bacterium]|nr:hypothetical protein [Paracoccaceae bacterium]